MTNDSRALKEPIDLFLSLFNSILGLSVLFPVLGPLGRELGLSDAQIGLISSGYALSQFIFAPMWGRASETRGRKPVLLIGVSGFGIGFLAFGLYKILKWGDGNITSGSMTFYDNVVFPFVYIFDPLVGRSFGRSIYLRARKKGTFKT